MLTSAVSDWQNPSLYPDCRALLFFLAPREAYRPIIFSRSEIFCGPDCRTVESEGKIHSIRTPAGVYSIEPIVKALPVGHSPDVVIVKADATGRNFPVGMKSLTCPKVLILGNTQHLNRPIRTLLDYARQEQFDWIVTDHKRHHLHYFYEDGFKKVHWIPGFNIFPHKQIRTGDFRHCVSLVGQAAVWHPYRRYILDQLRRSCEPVEHIHLPQREAAKAYAQSKISLNCSLNGDMNLRVFEVLSSGGFLLTDRLSREAGLEILFKDGKHLCTFNDPSHLREQIHYHLQHSEIRETIARNGEKLFWERHRPEQKVAELANCVFGGELTSEYKISRDKRSLFHVPSPQALQSRVSMYEYIQELHLQRPFPRVCFSANTDPKLIADCSDLPRLRISLQGVDTESLNFLSQHIDLEAENSLNLKTKNSMPEIWDLLVLNTDEQPNESVELVVRKHPCLQVMLSGDHKMEIAVYLKKLGMRPLQEKPQIWGWFNYYNFLHLASGILSPSDLLNAIRKQSAGNVSDSERIHILGLLAYRHGDLETAHELIEQALFDSPKNLQILLSTIEHYRISDNLSDAIALLERLTALYPESFEFWNMLGNSLITAREFDSALEAFRQSIKFNSNQPEVAAIIESLLCKRQATNVKGRQNNFKRILIVNNLFPPQELGGYGRLLYDFSELLNQRGYDVHVLTSDTRYLGLPAPDEKHISRTLELYGEWKSGNTRTFDTETISRVVKKNVGVVETCIQNFGPDVCLFGNADFIGAQLINTLLENSIPVLQHLGNPQPGYIPQCSPPGPIYRLAAASKWLRNQLWLKGYPLKHIDVVYPGALVRKFYQSKLQDLDKLSIAYASIVLPYKGPQILLKALLELKARNIPFSTTIAGTSTDMQFVANLKSICTRAGLTEQVNFVGNLDRDSLIEMYKNHNVLVFPSLVPEAFGISQVEAMAAGSCVITSATGGAAEVVEDNCSGMVFTSGDHLSLTQKLIDLQKDPCLWDRLRRQGQQRAIEYFDLERSVDMIEDIFDQLVASKG